MHLGLHIFNTRVLSVYEISKFCPTIEHHHVGHVIIGYLYIYNMNYIQEFRSAFR